MSEGMSTRDAIRTFVGRYRQQQNCGLDEKGKGTGPLGTAYRNGKRMFILSG
jgi:hypothetical protein